MSWVATAWCPAPGWQVGGRGLSRGAGSRPDRGPRGHPPPSPGPEADPSGHTECSPASWSASHPPRRSRPPSARAPPQSSRPAQCHNVMMTDLVTRCQLPVRPERSWVESRPFSERSPRRLLTSLSVSASCLLAWKLLEHVRYKSDFPLNHCDESYQEGPPSSAIFETELFSDSLLDWGHKLYVSTLALALARESHTATKSRDLNGWRKVYKT